MFNDPLIDMEKASKHKTYVYLVAAICTVIFAITLFLAQLDFDSVIFNGKKTSETVLIIAYSVLAIVYLITLYQLKVAMKELAQLDTERHSVLY